MNAIKNIIGILLIALLFSCQNEWDEHYDTTVNTVNTNVWDAIQQDPELSLFAGYVKKYQYDTLFLSDQTYTFFIPDNNALSQFSGSDTVIKDMLNYHISKFYILSENIEGVRKIQTLGGKFAIFNNDSLDNIPLIFESPLYLNGKYFVMNTLTNATPNLYEYFAINNVLLRRYIDDFDTLILDKSRSRPISFDSDGNTIYDTVATLYNMFEGEYFPVKHELRNKTATFVFPIVGDYDAGLDFMAQKLVGTNYTDHNNIPLAWQNKVLIPYLLTHGVFENKVEESEFVFNKDSLIKWEMDTFKMKNILGDSVVINYMPSQKKICSNGYAYNYADFKIPGVLYDSIIRFEAEHLLRNTGANRWSWKDGVKVTYGAKDFPPIQDFNQAYASADSSLTVNYTKDYNGVYSVEFNVNNLFPRKHLMIVKTNASVGGKYKIYVNDVLVKTIDYYSFINGFYPSVYKLGKAKNYKWDAGKMFIKFDCWINSNVLTTYGKAKIKFEYAGFGLSAGLDVISAGLSIDCIDFDPLPELHRYTN